MMNVVLFFKLANLVLGTFPTSVWAQDNVFLDAGQNDLSISSHDFNQIFSRYDNGIIDKKGANCLRSIFTKSSLTCNDMETDFNAMNKAAILLTSCDLEGTDLILPEHCEARNIENDSQGCLQTIEKSNQLWTTFTIHKQNLLAHCYALKRLNDEDEARNLYQIATKEKIVLLKLLQTKIEESHVKMQQEWVIWQEVHANTRERETNLELISSKGEVQLKKFEDLITEVRDKRDEEDFIQKTRMVQSLHALSNSANKLIYKTTVEISKAVSNALIEQESRNKDIMKKQSNNFGRQLAALTSIEQDLSSAFEKNKRTLSATYDEHINSLQIAQEEANQISTSLTKAEDQLQYLLDLHASHTRALLDEVLTAQGAMNAASTLLNDTVRLKLESDIGSSWIGSLVMGLFPKAANLDTKLTRLACRYRKIKALLKLTKIFGSVSAFIFHLMADALYNAIRKLMGGSMLFMILWRAIFRTKLRRIVRTHLPSLLAGQEIKILERSIDDPERALNAAGFYRQYNPAKVVRQEPNTFFDQRQCRLLVDSKKQLAVDRVVNHEKK